MNVAAAPLPEDQQSAAAEQAKLQAAMDAKAAMKPLAPAPKINL